MTREEAIKELQEEWEIFLEGTGLKYKTEEGFQKELDDNLDLKKVVEANYMAIKALEQISPCDLCLYNPPSSGDGKPCSMCPACSGGDEE